MQANGIASAVLFSCLPLAASVWDFKKRIIPDTICVAIAGLGLLTFTPGKLLGILPALLLLCAALFYCVPRHVICKLKKSNDQTVNQTALPLVPFLSTGFIAALIFEIIGGIPL